MLLATPEGDEMSAKPKLVRIMPDKHEADLIVRKCLTLRRDLCPLSEPDCPLYIEIGRYSKIWLKCTKCQRFLEVPYGEAEAKDGE